MSLKTSWKLLKWAFHSSILFMVAYRIVFIIMLGWHVTASDPREKVCSAIFTILCFVIYTIWIYLVSIFVDRNINK